MSRWVLPHSQKRKRMLLLFSFSETLLYNRMTALPFAVNAMPNWAVCGHVTSWVFNPIRPEAGKLFNTYDSSKLKVLGVVYEQAFSWSWIYSDAVVNGHHEVTEHLKARGGTISEFQLAHLMNSAASTGDIKTLKRLIRWTGQVNVSDFDGQTPLHTAAMYGRLNVTNLLLKEGAGKYNVKSRGKQLTITDLWFVSGEWINYLPKLKAEANSWSARHWQNTIFCNNWIQ